MMTREDALEVITQVTNAWNDDPANEKVWVIGANSGDWVSIPKYVRFQSEEKPVAGMTIHLRGFAIVLNLGIVPESFLSTFFHELGHVKHRQNLGDDLDLDLIESEIWAIRFSLQALETHGCFALAYREADQIKTMASEDPYRSAVERLKNDPVWQKYSGGERP
jgi:hypothetical protein